MNDVTADCQSAKYEEKNKREPDDSRTEQKYTSGLYPETIDKTYAGIKCRENERRRNMLAEIAARSRQPRTNSNLTAVKTQNMQAFLIFYVQILQI